MGEKIVKKFKKLKRRIEFDEKRYKTGNSR